MSWLLSWAFPGRSVPKNDGPHISERLSSVKEAIQKNIDSYDVMIFSKSYCPYCIKAKDAIRSQGVNFGVIELDQVANGADIQEELLRATGQRTVPNIFIKGKHLGGCDDTLESIRNGKFAQLISASR